MKTTPDIDGLDDFGRSRARHLTEFFVGRQSEMQAIRDAVRVVEERYRQAHPKPGGDGAVLITGVPGAGKTSLMDRLRRDWSEPEGNGPIGVSLGLDDLAGRAALAQALQRNVPAGVRGWVATRLSSISVGALGAGVSFDLAQPSDDIGNTGRPIVLFIDEIQRIPIDDRAPEVRLLAILHEGTHGAPIQPVLAGLAHARKRLEDVGLSRIAPVLALGRLSPDEVRESVTRFLDRFRVAGDRSGWPDIITRSAEGWPMHLHNSLTSLAAELAANGGDLDHIDRFAVRRRAAAPRFDYYGQRTSGRFEKHPVELGALMESIGTAGRRRPDLDRLIREHFGAIPPPGDDPDDMVDAMLAKGLIQPGPRRGRYHCPIPSLRSWCAAHAGSDLHIVAIEGDAAAVRNRLAAGDDPNATDARTRTPLHIVAEENWPEIAELLIAGGADPEARDNAGRRAVDLARRGSETWRLLAGPPMPVDAKDWILGSDSPLETLRRLDNLSDDELLHTDGDALVARLTEEARAQAEQQHVTLQGNPEAVLRAILDRAQDGSDVDGGGDNDEMPDSTPDRSGGREP